MAGPTNFGELKAIIAREMGEDVNNDISAEIDRAVLAAIDFYSENSIWFLEAVNTDGETVSGTPNYDLPEELNAIVEVTIPDWPLSEITFERLRALKIGAVNAKPQFWAKFDEDLWFHPTPNAVYDYTIYHRVRLPELTIPTSTNAWITHGWRLLRAHAEWDLSKHVLHSSPQPPEAYWQTTQVELAKLEQRSRGRGKHREPQAAQAAA
jgi:hypothetical protein